MDILDLMVILATRTACIRYSLYFGGVLLRNIFTYGVIFTKIGWKLGVLTVEPWAWCMVLSGPGLGTGARPCVDGGRGPVPSPVLTLLSRLQDGSQATPASDTPQQETSTHNPAPVQVWFKYPLLGRCEYCCEIPGQY